MKICDVCGNQFEAKRKHATTCSAKCRKRKSRQSVTPEVSAAAISVKRHTLPKWVKLGVELVSPSNVGMSRYSVVIKVARDHAVIRTRYSERVVVDEVMLASEFHPDPGSIPKDEYPRADRQNLGSSLDFDD